MRVGTAELFYSPTLPFKGRSGTTMPTETLFPRTFYLLCSKHVYNAGVPSGAKLASCPALLVLGLVCVRSSQHNNTGLWRQRIVVRQQDTVQDLRTWTPKRSPSRTYLDKCMIKRTHYLRQRC